MKKEELDSLLEKYYSGSSTAEEELRLKEFFSSENVPEAYQADKEIFAYYKRQSGIPEPSGDFESRIMAGIDTQEIRKSNLGTRRYLYPLIGVAASILVLIGSYFFLSENRELKDTYSDPKIAYAETMKILTDVSSKMNKATLALEPVGKINKATNKSFASINKSAGLIEKSLKNLNYLQSANYNNIEHK